MDSVSTSIITVQEMWNGWTAAISKSKTAEHLARVYQRFTNTITDLKYWKIESFSTAAIERFHSLMKQKLNVGAYDLKIAAIALEAGAIVVTRNLRDFQRVPGLICEDWSKTTG
jgi:tRNA(fMet)-specific endonuclease VapC